MVSDYLPRRHHSKLGLEPWARQAKAEAHPSNVHHHLKRCCLFCSVSSLTLTHASILASHVASYLFLELSLYIPFCVVLQAVIYTIQYNTNFPPSLAALPHHLLAVPLETTNSLYVCLDVLQASLYQAVAMHHIIAVASVI